MSDFEQAKWAVSHDPCRSGDRTPTGAVPEGTIVHLTLHVDEASRSAVTSATVLVGERAEGYSGLIWNDTGLTACEAGYAGFLAIEASPHVIFYVFRLHLADGSTAYYVPRVDGRATAGELVAEGIDGYWSVRGWVYSDKRMAERPTEGFGLSELPPGFQVTVFEPAFATPKWMSGAIMYQIFPDRFSRSPQGVLEEGLAYHEKMARPVRLHEGWDEPVDWEPLDESSPDPKLAYYDPVDFYGGTLEGIRRNLGHIASLGVEAIYLNPVFESRSSHRYDTADYERIDPLLGTEEDLARLAEDAGKLGISLILDVALSHTGDDSRYFNARGTYEQPGAAQGGQSPYFKWYDFECISGRVPYRCWWGDPSLPEVEEHDPLWQSYIMGEGGILERWLRTGIKGYRLDVADEIPDDVLELIRSCVKDIDPDAAIIGEVWEDATSKVSYGVPRTYALGAALDSVMNYPMRSMLLGFALGTLDAYQLVSFLRLQQSNYPSQLHACLMNLLSSHDVERVRSALALGQPIRHYTRAEQLELVSGITRDQDARAIRMQRMIVALLYALPGVPCIYYGDERGLQGGGDPFCRATMVWDREEADARPDCGADLTAFYREVGALRKGSPALRKGSLACAAPDSQVVCLARVHCGQGAVVVVAANRSDEPRTVAFDASAPEFGLSSGDRWALRSITGDVSASFSSSYEAAPALHCEDGIVRATVPPRATVYWRTAIA